MIFHKISCEDGKELKILFVGLGNRAVTPDALGPYVADHLEVNRHIVKEYGKYAMRTEQLIVLSAIVPGVMGQTGMETAEIVRGIVYETKPDLILAVDALAARNSRRLNRTIQIADTGIHPGSGVGNYRNAMTEESLGIPVIGIGVPTVVDAATIVNANIFHEILGNLLLLFFVLWLMIIYPCIIIPELFLIQVFKFLRSYDRHTKLYRIKHGIIIILKQGTVIRKCHQTCDLPGFFTSDQGISYLQNRS